MQGLGAKESVTRFQVTPLCLFINLKTITNRNLYNPVVHIVIVIFVKP